MVTQVLRRLTSGITPVIGLMLLLLVSLWLMGDATENSARFGRLYSALLLINGVGLISLLVLIGINLLRLLRQYREGIAGSRLTLRMVVIFVALAFAPVSVVYYFSMQFLHRGIDSWFDVRIDRALEDALKLSQSAIDLRMQTLLRETERMRDTLTYITDLDIPLRLDELREMSGAAELTLIAPDGAIVASSNIDPTIILPHSPSEEILLQLRQGHTYVKLDPIGDAFFARIALNLRVDPVTGGAGGNTPVLQALFRMPDRISNLGGTVQDAYTQYRELAFLRRPLKDSFTLTLSLVLLLSVFSAVIAAFYFARRLTAPIRDLAEGTRAVAAGHYDKRLKRTSRDELGFLVQSFNIMTRRIAEASETAQRSQVQVETQKAYLEAVLGHLSSGVLTLDAHGGVRTANTAVQRILGIGLGEIVGRDLAELGREDRALLRLVETLRGRLKAGEEAWSEQITLTRAGDRQVLLCAGKRLPVGPEGGGHVIVLDDVTALVQAQHSAAWGEVARRLAHEIKNPLTPIQLSAERLRHKYLPTLGKEEGKALERYTRTIIQQVSAMKEMVDAFSDYARAPRPRLGPVNLNEIVEDTMELYRHKKTGSTEISFQATSDLPKVRADADRVRQVLHNLIQNAQEALADRPSGRIEVNTHCAEGPDCPFVELTVQDNGPGISSEIMERLFQPYATNKPHGNGLGLAIVKKIVEEHGGMIRAENNPQDGARFTVSLPVAADEQGEATAEPAQPAHREPGRAARS